MGVKLYETVKADGSHYSWAFFCPACRSLHQCDSRWTFNGNTETPTFRASVLVHPVPEIGRPLCHSFVTDGKIAYLADCTHAFAGKTVDLPDWEDSPKFHGEGP
jgi:Family of unknown function (DUF6527)